MSIAIIISDRNVERFHQNLQQALPDIEVQCWPNIKKDTEIEFAVMWTYPENIWQSLPNLKVIQSLGAGCDKFIQDDTLPKNVEIARIIDPDLADQMADYCLAVIMGHKCQLKTFWQAQSARKWQWQRHKAMSKVTILGIGEIGHKVAEKLRLNGFEVSGWSRTAKADKKYQTFSGRDDLEAAVNGAEFLINVLPDTAATKNLINEQLLGNMEKHGVFINVGRGNTVDEDSLLEALDNNVIEHAILDVFKQEPLPEQHPFWGHEKVTITPHISAVTANHVVLEQTLKNYLKFKKGEPIPSLINREFGY